MKEILLRQDHREPNNTRSGVSQITMYRDPDVTGETENYLHNPFLYTEQRVCIHLQ